MQQHLNVVDHPAKAKQQPSYGKHLDNADAVMLKLRLEMYEYDVDALANLVGVSKSCIMAIRRGSTKWPRPKTFFGLLDALDMRMYIDKRN